MKNRQSSSSLPFTVVGGFLGAGKTTLLNRLLADPEAPRCAVLVNDFGAIAVDESLIESHGGETIALKNGCVCCSMGNDLGLGISKVLDLETPPEHIVVEASGVAHPGRVADVARISPELAPGGIFVLADAIAIRAQLNDRWISDTVEQQLQSAQCILLSKLDDLPPENQSVLIDELSARYPAHSLAATTDLEWARLLSAVDDRQPADIPSATHANFVTRTIRSTALVDLHKLRNWIENNRDVYRMKGWVVDKNDGKVKLIQAVGQRINITRSDVGIENRYQIVAIIIGNQNLPSSQAILSMISGTGKLS